MTAPIRCMVCASGSRSLGAVENVAGWRRGIARDRHEGAELVGADGCVCVHGPLPPGASGGIGKLLVTAEKFR